MARIKCTPRVAQPDLERQVFTPTTQITSNSIDKSKIMSNQTSDEQGYHDTDNPVLSKMAEITRSNEPASHGLSPTTESEKPTSAEMECIKSSGKGIFPTLKSTGSSKKAVVPETVTVTRSEPLQTRQHSGNAEPPYGKYRPVLESLTCPQCSSEFPNMGIMEYREHVESCSRPITGDSESTSSLSPPPESDQDDEDDEDPFDPDHVVPYVIGKTTSYPKTNTNAAQDTSTETVGQQPPTISFRQMTDPQKIVETLTDPEALPYDKLYNRVKNAVEVAIEWQCEYIDLGHFVQKNVPPPPNAKETTKENQKSKPNKNPRIPKDYQIGIGYQDELESFVYGFEYQYHPTKVGKQDPVRQRLMNGLNGGRELRQRVPTQKAVEADLSTTPDSDEGINTRRRGRGQKSAEGATDVDSAGGRGQRARNNSRIGSQSRDQTPAATFPSGKKVGRPAKAKLGGAARVQELQREGGFDSDSTSEPSHEQNTTNSTAVSGSLARKRSYANHGTSDWLEDSEPDEETSRPVTSDSTMSGPSDDMSNLPIKSSGKGRKRQNTSDFEDALPSHKRIRKTHKLTANGISDIDLVQSTKDVNNAEKARNTRRGRQDEDGLRGNLSASEVVAADSTSRSQDLVDIQASSSSRVDSSLQKGQNGKERKVITLKTSNGVLHTSANHLPGSSAQRDGKDSAKISRASMNMRRRWAAKKEAEALGLPVPKIGRYPKGESAPSTPDVAGDVDPFIQSKIPGGRKRKRDDEEPTTADVGNSDAAAINSEAPVVGKKRSGRPKMTQNADFLSNAGSVEKDTNRDGDISKDLPPRVDEMNNEEHKVQNIPKKKGGRPRKKPLEIESPLLDVQEGLEPAQQSGFIINESHSNANDAGALTLHQDVESTNEEPGSAQPQLRRTERVRRRTSAALSASSQANTIRSGRNSQKSTVTPTPAPTQQIGEETVIKEETVNGPTLPKKRGRQPKSAKVDTDPEAMNARIEDEAPPAKRRKVVRKKKVVNTGSSPTVSEEEGTIPVGGLTYAHTLAIPGSAAGALGNKSRGESQPRSPNVEHSPVMEGSWVHQSTNKSGDHNRDDALSVDLVKETALENQTAGQEPPKKKGNWGGKRVKGVYSSGVAPKLANASEVDSNNAEDDGVEDQTQSKGLSALEIDVRAGSVRSSLMGSRNKGDLTKAFVPSGDRSADGTNSAGLPNGSTYATRLVSKALALAGDVNNQGDELEALPRSSSRPKQLTNIVEASSTERSLNGAIPDVPSGASARPRRPITKSKALRYDEDPTEEALDMSREPARRVNPLANGSEEGVGETGADDHAPGALSRPKRVITMKFSTAGSQVIDKVEKSANAALVAESGETEANGKVEKKKTIRRAKATKSINEVVDEDVATKVDSNNDDSDSEATRKEKRKQAAKASKALKNSQSMKARWANGSMAEVMRKKKEANVAKKAAAARAAGNGEDLEELTAAPASGPASAPASATSKRKVAPTKVVAGAPKRRRTMNATMDGAADTDDEYDIPEAFSSSPTSPTTRKVSEYERYKQLSSPLRSTHGRRRRRPAALRASQSFSKFAENGGDGVDMMDADDEDVETELKKQFDSEYEHFRAQSPPVYRGLQSSNIIPGKRKPKPVINLAEAMRIEAGDDDDFLIEG